MPTRNSGQPRRRGINAVGYARRSTDRQEQSIPDQKKAIDDYVQENGFRLGRVYVDDAISGTSTLGRRAFLEMITDAQKESHPFDFVIVYDVKRFGRVDNDEAGYYRHVLRTHGVEVRYVSENFNGDSTDDLLRPVKQWQARQESKDLSKVTIRGLLSKIGYTSGSEARNGWWMGGVPPHGYDLRYVNADGKFVLTVRYMPDGQKRILDEKGKLARTLGRGESLNLSQRDNAKLAPSSPDRVTVITSIFTMYVEPQKGYNAIADTLNRDGVPTARNEQWSRLYTGHWSGTTIRAILMNPIYAGDMVWNRRTDGRFHRISNGCAVERDAIHGQRLVPNPESDWITVRDAHPALISRRMFERAKQQRESHPSSALQRGHNPRLATRGRCWNGRRALFILSGLVTCERCGNRYQGVTRTKGKKRIDGTRVVTRYYGCGGYIRQGRKTCEAGLIPRARLEQAVIDAVLEFYRPYLEDGGRKKLTDLVKQQLGTEQQDVGKARERASDELERVTETINRLLDSISPENRDVIDPRLKTLNEQRQTLEARLDELDRLTASQTEIRTVVSDTMRFLAALPFTLREGVPQEKLGVLRQCVVGIAVAKSRVNLKATLNAIPSGGTKTTQQISVYL